MSAAPKRVTRSQSKRKAATSSQPTIAEVFAKKRGPAKPQSTDTHEPPPPAEPVIDVTSSAAVTPAPVPAPELVLDVVEEEPRPTTTKVAGTKQPDGSKPTKVFPLFSRSKPPAAPQPPPEETTLTYPSSKPIEFARSDETFLQALEASEGSKPPPAKSRFKKWKSVPSNNDMPNGLSAEDPIVLDLSPTRTRSLPVKTKLFDLRAPLKPKNKRGFGSLDAPLPNRETQHVRGLQTAFDNNSADIPFERRTRDPFAPTSAGEPSTPSLTGIIDYPQHPPTPSDQHSTLPPPPPPSDIPAEYRSRHPVFWLFPETADPPGVNQPTMELWVDEWAPRLAEHVLGNEGHALYLRDWLKASEINSFSGSVKPSTTSTPASSSQPKKKPPAKRGTKRPRIRREVGNKKAKKRRRRDDDWIVHDDYTSLSEPESESHPLDAYLDDAPSSDGLVFDEFPLEGEVPLIDLPPLAYDCPNAFDMSNTIILCGPPGSGKTAAVYACATELDWEVFEVYPGIGKRSGAALDNLIGQVGRNHLVTKQGGGHPSPPPPEKGNALTRFLGVTGVQILEEPEPKDGSSDGTDIPDIGGIEIVSDDGLGVLAPPLQDDPPPVVESDQRLRAQAKQSLILLEEVDILYRDDVNFWPTVVSIIRDCRRPVILTCNDINLLPLDQLPVQKILSFTQPPTPVVAAYLSAICRIEGTQPDEHFFSTLQTRSVVDLRQCINQCQLGKSTRSFDTTHEGTTRNNWENVLDQRAHFPQWALPPQDEPQRKALFHCLAKHTDNVSYLDSRLVLHVDTDWSNPTPGDDEIGYRILPTGDLTPPEFAHYHHDIEVAEETLSLTSRVFGRAHPLLGASATSPENLGGSNLGMGFVLGNAQLELASSNHRFWMNQLAADLSVTLPLDHRLFLEYESVVREMVVADDKLEACIHAAQEAETAQHGQSGRQTRNSQSQRLKVGYYRYLDLESDRKDWLVRATFGGRLL